MEHVGETLHSVQSYVQRHPSPPPYIKNAFLSPDSAAKHLFELAYGAHCLHAKLGVAHTDLHTNNMTLYPWGQTPSEITREPFYENPVVAYVVGPRGEADTYVFPASSVCACIIDYSRAILGPDFPAFVTGTPSAAAHFLRDQTNRVMRTLHRYAPTFVEKNELPIRAAAIAQFDSVFRVICAADFIAIGRNLAPLMGPHAGLAKQLENEAQELFVAGLKKLVVASKVDEFPGTVLLERIFGHWKWTQQRQGAQLVDAYNFNNTLRYSGADYAKYPPWAQLRTIETHLGKYTLSDLFARGVDPFLESLRPGVRVEAIAEALRIEQEELDGRRNPEASSWLD
jgi:hypothetical protein